ncbi:NAD(P)H:quinone oxidoreductase [Frankia sp. AiPs1]|uniref:NAD(P)H-binding protein n=1 Tax=Frankia sp. AiPa1 TaxID=573492 RepID=UPI00202B7EB4|nr:NAD(P)H-binding protein [Frankia sp. AiPa1]MCL9761312.1 NAD(P)H-binding protein [Frankia sp. AiPa1]
MIVVTGATGHLGRLVVDELLRRGVPAAELAVVVRTPAKAAGLAELGIDVRAGDYTEPANLAAAFAGAERLLFVSATGPNSERVTSHRSVVEAAATAGVGSIAYTSIADADKNPIELADVHRDTEAAIVASGLPYTLLRNNWYFENYTATLAGAVERGGIVGAAGNGRLAAASRADFAAAAAVVLTEAGHEGKVYELTGDSAWTMAELAATAAAHSGTPVAYTDLPAEQYAAVLADVGLPPYMVDLLVDADLKIAEGALADVTDDLRTLIGRPTTTLADAVADALS